MVERIPYLIIGNGIAGITAAETLRAANSEARIALVAHDPYQVYYRPALKEYLAGKISIERLWARPESFYDDHRLFFLQGQVSEIHTQEHQLRLRNGLLVDYEHLLIASGAQARRLDCPGNNLPGVFTLRSIENFQDLEHLLNHPRKILVVGSGPLAIECADVLVHSGHKIIHLMRHAQLWRDTLDRTASDLILHEERRSGVEVVMEDDVSEIVGKHGVVEGVITGTGEWIECDLVIAAIGMEPNIEFARKSGIECGRGLLVDSLMRTNIPDIYAAGDVIESLDPSTQHPRLLGHWYTAIQQARLAAYSMLNQADETRIYNFCQIYHTTSLFGLSIIACGVTNIQGRAPQYQTVIAEPKPRSYQKVFLKQGVPLGMLAIGEVARPRAWKRAIDHKVRLTSTGHDLFATHFDLDLWLDQQNVPPAILGVEPRQPSPLLHYHTVPVEQKEEINISGDCRLVHIADRVTGLSFPDQTLHKQARFVVGRQPGVELLVEQGSVSRMHAEIIYLDGQYILQDLQSRNGTFVNDQRLMVGRPYILRNLDEVRFGNLVRFRFLQTALLEHKNTPIPATTSEQWLR